MAGAELVGVLEELAADQETHWFCPRSAEDPNGVYYDDDLSDDGKKSESEQTKAERLVKVKESRDRRDKALESCVILAFDGADAVPFQEKLKQCLAHQLSRCDVCIREFHRGRRLLRTQLETEYSADDVTTFMQTFDNMNQDRIANGLDVLVEQLLDLPPAERSINAVDAQGMYFVLEALNCVPFLRNEPLLEKHFDRPFRLIQTKKRLSLGDNVFVPASVAFLYSSNTERCQWASKNFKKAKRPMRKEEFEFGVKPWLAPAMETVAVNAMVIEYLPGFWNATRQIINALTPSLVEDELQTMDKNLFTLALDHFQFDASHFINLLSSVQMLLEKCGKRFWASTGAASPTHVIETICRSPQLEKLLTATTETEHLNLEERMAWVDPLILSIKPDNLVPPLRTLLDLLLHRYQQDKYSRYASRVAWEKGLSCLLLAISVVFRNVDGGPVYTHLIEAIAKDHITPILQELQGIEKKEEVTLSDTEIMDLDIIRDALALDIKGLVRARDQVLRAGELEQELGVTSLNLWKMTSRAIKAGNGALPTAILSGIRDFIRLDNLPPKSRQKAPKQVESWDNALNRVQNHIVADLIDRLDAFSPEQLEGLYMDKAASRGMMALLFNANDKIHQGALGLFKNFTGQDSRPDSIKHVVSSFTATTLEAAGETLKLIAEAKIFGPCQILMRLCTDIFTSLCDSGDGLLRRRGLQVDAEHGALKGYYYHVWATIIMIFDSTEAWSGTGLAKEMMQEFCRDTMDFAELAFDQYAVIAGSLTAGAGKNLLQSGPRRAFKSIAKWLRLRDDYLIDRAVALTSNILLRLQSESIQIPSDATQYVGDILTDNVKTRLSRNHKAELRRALERHTGEVLGDSDEIKKKQQSSLEGWALPGQDKKSSSSIPTAKAGVIDFDTWTKTAEQKNDAIKAKKAKLAAEQAKFAQKKQAASSQDFLAKRKAALAEQQKQKEAALAKAKGLGAGSGVVGLGNLGADHDTKGQTVMVDSDEEDSEEEDDDVDDDLFGTAGKPKKQERAAVDFSGATGLRPEVKQGPTRINRTTRSLKDMRARLKPDLGPLHRIMLGWEFFHDDDFPPGTNQAEFAAVANSYRDPDTYQKTFEPLLLLEAWQGMIKSREENTTKPYEIKVQNRSNVDHFIEISSLLGHPENRDLQLSEGDIILFSKAQKPTDNPDEPHCLARVHRVKRQKAHLEIVYQVTQGSNLVSQLTMQSVVFGLKVQSITPLEREYGALKGLVYYDLCNQIVRAKPSQKINFSERQVQSFQDVWNLNRAQSEAVNGALENEGFSLIQGPPGSGKTKTIVAIVGGLLSQTLANAPKGATRISVPRSNGAMPGSDAPSKKLLVCAPSNAAVDEIVMRLKSGVKVQSGTNHAISVVRIGRSEAMNSQVADVSMETLVARKLGNGNEADEKQGKADAELFKEHEHVSARLRELYQQRDANEKMEQKERKQVEDDIVSVRRRKAELGARIDSVKDNQRNAGREQEMNRKRAQQAVLDQAHVICATLSGSGHDMFQALNIEFETVIIDEAAQCVEMSSLIPLKYGCIKCIMVGDPKQLPPTVFSKEAAKFQYEQSLFVRMQNNHPDEVHLLDTQYRMHPDISVFPSRTFYDGLLKDGEGMAGLRKQPWHASALLAPYRFFDVSGQHQSAPKGHSLINRAEIDISLLLYSRLRTDFPDYDFTGKIGIITPYKSQLRELKNTYVSRYGEGILDTIEFNTTDAFQGRESEIIIFSCVRASPAGGIGFLQDIRRMNVGLTRAKSSLWVLGNSDSLARGRYWKKLVDDAQARDCYTTGDIKQMLHKSSKAFPASTSSTKSMPDAGNHERQMEGAAISRKTSVTASREPSPAARKPQPDNLNGGKSMTDGQRQGSADDRMEGISYKFEDRVAKHKKPKLGTATPAEDVEMGEADSEPERKPDRNSSTTPSNASAAGIGRGASPPASNGGMTGSRSATPVSRGGTPLSGISGADGSGTGQADGTTKLRPLSAAPAGVQPKLVKRKAPTANPFMPKQRKR